MNMDSKKKMVASATAASTGGEAKGKPTSTADETILAKVGGKFKLMNVKQASTMTTKQWALFGFFLIVAVSVGVVCCLRAKGTRSVGDG